MRYNAKVEVRTKKSQVDPEGEVITKSLIDLDFPVSKTRTGKIYELTLEASSGKEATRTIEQICSRLLVNPVKDDYNFEVVEVGNKKQDD